MRKNNKKIIKLFLIIFSITLSAQSYAMEGERIYSLGGNDNNLNGVSSSNTPVKYPSAPVLDAGINPEYRQEEVVDLEKEIKSLEGETTHKKIYISFFNLLFRTKTGYKKEIKKLEKKSSKLEKKVKKFKGKIASLETAVDEFNEKVENLKGKVGTLEKKANPSKRKEGKFKFPKKTVALLCAFWAAKACYDLIWTELDFCQGPHQSYSLYLGLKPLFPKVVEMIVCAIVAIKIYPPNFYNFTFFKKKNQRRK